MDYVAVAVKINQHVLRIYSVHFRIRAYAVILQTSSKHKDKVSKLKEKRCAKIRFTRKVETVHSIAVPSPSCPHT